mmetsp:Transcript_10250/g.47054  ORF Transcript_10250/g.47054 Transcript_10250/m.47054 type:complete len:301 (+) Transcript_10250:1197-2099(+)
MCVVMSIWLRMYRRKMLCQYRSTTSSGTDSDWGESWSLNMRLGALPVLADPFAIGLSFTGESASNISGALSAPPFIELTDQLADLLCAPFCLLGLALTSPTPLLPLAKRSRLTESLLREIVPSRLTLAPGAFFGNPYPPAFGGCCPGGFITMDPGSAPSLFLAPGDASTAALSACDGKTFADSSASTWNAVARSSLVCAADAKHRSARGGRRSGGTSGLTRATHTPMPRRLARAATSASNAFSSATDAPTARRRGTIGEQASASVVKPGTLPESAASRSAAADACALSTSLGSAETRRMA